MFSRTAISLVTILLLAMTAFAGIPSKALANQAQLHILNTGVNLGWAEARAWFYGASAEAMINRDLMRAASHISAAEQQFSRIYRISPMRKETIRLIQSNLANYSAKTTGRPNRHKAAYISILMDQYRATLQSTLVSLRPDALQYNSTCDSLLLQAGFAFGRARIAAEVPGHRARARQSGAVGTFSRAKTKGIQISMDSQNRRLITPGVKKLCCSFGNRSSWSSLPRLDQTTPPEVFDRMLPTLQSIADNATLAAGACGGRPVHNNCSGMPGRWHWPKTGVVMEVCPDGSLKAFQGSRVVQTGHWKCSNGGSGPARVVFTWIESLRSDKLSLAGGRLKAGKFTASRLGDVVNCPRPRRARPQPRPQPRPRAHPDPLAVCGRPLKFYYGRKLGGYILEIILAEGSGYNAVVRGVKGTAATTTKRVGDMMWRLRPLDSKWYGGEYMVRHHQTGQEIWRPWEYKVKFTCNGMTVCRLRGRCDNRPYGRVR